MAKIYTSTHTQAEIDNGVDNAICYGTSSTGASTAQKAVTVSTGSFSLTAGRKIVVKFSNANTAGTPTLKVGTNAAKNIFNKGSQITTGSNKALLAGVCEFIYDGTQFHLIGSYIDTSAGGTAVTLNGVSKAGSTASFFAPTTAGTSGHYLKSNGSGAPTWATSPSAEDAYSAIRLLFGIGWGGYTVNEVSNAEWQKALLDSQNKVIAGIKADGTFWTADLS